MKTNEQLQDHYRRSDAHVRARGVDAGSAQGIYGNYTGFIHRLYPPPGNLLDIGCGNGWSAYLFSRLGYQTVGADMNAAFFEPPANERLHLQEASVLDLPFAADSFDVVAANQMLEHVPEPGRALTEMLRVLRPGGVLCIVGPNLISPLHSLNIIFRYVWSNRPPQRIFFRGEGMPRHPGGNTVFEGVGGLFRNLGRVLARLLPGRAHFEMREPDLIPPFSSDNDACYLCNPLDLVKFFRSRGCRILQNGKPGRPAFTSILVGGTWVAIRKPAVSE